MFNLIDKKTIDSLRAKAKAKLVSTIEGGENTRPVSIFSDPKRYKRYSRNRDHEDDYDDDDSRSYYDDDDYDDYDEDDSYYDDDDSYSDDETADSRSYRSESVTRASSKVSNSTKKQKKMQQQQNSSEQSVQSSSKQSQVQRKKRTNVQLDKSSKVLSSRRSLKSKLGSAASTTSSRRSTGGRSVGSRSTAASSRRSSNKNNNNSSSKSTSQMKNNNRTRNAVLATPEKPHRDKGVNNYPRTPETEEESITPVRLINSDDFSVSTTGVSMLGMHGVEGGEYEDESMMHYKGPGNYRNKPYDDGSDDEESRISEVFSRMSEDRRRAKDSWVNGGLSAATQSTYSGTGASLSTRQDQDTSYSSSYANGTSHRRGKKKNRHTSAGVGAGALSDVEEQSYDEDEEDASTILTRESATFISKMPPSEAPLPDILKSNQNDIHNNAAAAITSLFTPPPPPPPPPTPQRIMPSSSNLSSPGNHPTTPQSTTNSSNTNNTQSSPASSVLAQTPIHNNKSHPSDDQILVEPKLQEESESVASQDTQPTNNKDNTKEDDNKSCDSSIASKDDDDSDTETEADDDSIRATPSMDTVQADNTNQDSMEEITDEPLLTASNRAEILSSFYDIMTRPSQDLANLLSNIYRPPKHDEKTLTDQDGNPVTHKMDRPFMTRRKNACGALKVLTSAKKNRGPICWTIGVLTSITSVLNDGGPQGPEKQFNDDFVLAAYYHARKRSLQALGNLCTSPRNRVLIFLSPGLVTALVHVTHLCRDDVLPLACTCLALLSKEVENRELLCIHPNILNAMASVIQPPPIQQGGKGPHVKLRMNHTDGSNQRGEEDEIMLQRTCSVSTMGNTNVDNRRGVGEMFSEDENDDDTGGSLSNDDESISYNQIPALEGIELVLPMKKTTYDNDSSPHMVSARLSIFAALSHLCKVKVNTHVLCKHRYLMKVLIIIAGQHDSPSHVRSMVILSHLTRNQDNTLIFIREVERSIETLILGTRSPDDECRKHACFALQNLSYLPNFCPLLVKTPGLITSLCECACKSEFEEEQFAAMSALKNLSREGSCAIALFNTAELMPVLLLQIQDVDEQNPQHLKLRYIASDTLATLGYTIRKVATTTKASRDGEFKFQTDKNNKRVLCLVNPTFTTSTWNQWN
mmetsp:Transcript_19979/g.28113  ORF Transcript_19979/g.28113 Transcript_19979/m.28113 type:complete len:1146 (-) Transcript_19979:311-3748(-)|eukprot:CAMPEP_0184866842 /NCGR_PEP_ID=MMETSP0580-20130426/23970_1 /TAXON_ID=1118495 /ORGANISM="Dactyliosolen fragilissimus" /LENGTH=1145 /DNA_ID=CAMNT_0027366753 /DNA_START=258 /DNA_END=3695 /DNA_ORIENTATION=+